MSFYFSIITRSAHKVPIVFLLLFFFASSETSPIDLTNPGFIICSILRWEKVSYAHIWNEYVPKLGTRLRRVGH